MCRPKLLNGIRVVDLSMGWAGPLAARHLADMGAEVIKVEGCVRFDWWRGWEATQSWIDDNNAEKSVAFNTVNRNKPRWPRKVLIFRVLLHEVLITSPQLCSLCNNKLINRLLL